MNEMNKMGLHALVFGILASSGLHPTLCNYEAKLLTTDDDDRLAAAERKREMKRNKRRRNQTS